MKMTKQEYEDLIRKRPGLAPDEVVVCRGAFKTNLSPQQFLDKAFGPKRELPIKLTIPGQPVPKPRMTQQDRWKKRPCVMRYWAWADKARSHIPDGADLLGVGHIEMRVYLEIPKSYSKKKRKELMGQAHRGRGDCDNYVKACQDSLLKQDCGIWNIVAQKRWEDEKGARMEVCLY